jgi:hypothetical protein
MFCRIAENQLPAGGFIRHQNVAVSPRPAYSSVGISHKLVAEKLVAKAATACASSQDDRVTIFTLPEGMSRSRKPKDKEDAMKRQASPVNAKSSVTPPNKSQSLARMLRRRNADNERAGGDKFYGARGRHVADARVNAEPEIASQASGNDSYTSQEEAEEVCHDNSSGSTTPPPPCMRVIYSYLCPHCSASVASEEEARAHCNQANKREQVEHHHRQAEYFMIGTPSREREAQQRHAHAEWTAQGTFSVLAVDSFGLPLISIWKDPTTGKQCTVVAKDDGSERAFGQETVESCVDETEDKALLWLASLTNNELKGLLNEFHHHVAESSKLYHERKSALDILSIQASYSFFGLQQDTSEKELDNAYRQLARRMHPDKNGGTEEAKEKFQLMKEHYEAIKRHRAEDGASQAEPQTESRIDPHKTENRDEQKAPAQASISDLLAETQRSPLNEAALHMIGVLKNIKSNMRILQTEQDKLLARSST